MDGADGGVKMATSGLPYPFGVGHRGSAQCLSEIILSHVNRLWFKSGDLIRGAPMWTAKNRGRYDRSKLRYPSDLTDDEWAHVELLIPPAKRGGNKRHVDVREVMNGIMYILSTGCQWRAVPKDLPPRSTLFDYLDLWSYDGTLDRIHHALYMECREQDEREAGPTAAIIDSQSVKSAEKGGLASIRMAMMRARKSRGRNATFS
jgi:transposase